ncbi:MAG: hypothetical protein JWQ10_179 [Herbaspirillum sp.]|nr:hypothetical protein [Herbaspirillum sp.]
MPLKFINPFIGSPSPIPLTGLFLFRPDIFWDISGFSQSGIFKLIGKESLFKRLNAIKPGDKIEPERLRKLMKEVLDASDASDEFREKFLSDVEIAIENEDKGEFDPSSFRMYETAIAASNPPGKKLTAPQEFFLEVERESEAALSLMHKQRFADAAQEILNNEFFAPFLWEGAREALGRVTSVGALFIVRTSLAMEVFLASMVIYELEYEATAGIYDLGLLLDIWPTVDAKVKNSFGMFFEWVKKQSGARTLGEFFNHPSLHKVDSMDEVRLKRWSSGRHQPKKEWLDEIAKALWGDVEHPAFQMRLATAQRVNFLGFFYQQILTLIPKDMTPNQAQEVYPWPFCPHEYSDFALWGRERYPIWREFACDYQAKKLE